MDQRDAADGAAVALEGVEAWPQSEARVKNASSNIPRMGRTRSGGLPSGDLHGPAADPCRVVRPASRQLPIDRTEKLTVDQGAG